MTRSEIETQLNNETKRFYNSKFDGEVPDATPLLFRNGIRTLAPNFYKVGLKKIKDILLTDKANLTMAHLKVIITVIINTPLEKLYPRERDCLVMVQSYILFEDFVVIYNAKIDNFQTQLEDNKKKLYEAIEGSSDLLTLKAVGENG